MEWFEMGGYATYVWPVFGTAFLLVIGIALAPRLQHKRLIKELRVERQIDSED